MFTSKASRYGVFLNKHFYSSMSEMLQLLNWMPPAINFVYRTINTESTTLTRSSNALYIPRAKT